MKKFKISVGIPAFNEASNIASVLNEILGQEQSNWTLKKILVYSDGSTDGTIQVAKTVKSKFIKVVEGQKRIGKTARLSQMFKSFDGEILVMFDGDVKFANKKVISRMVEKFDDDKVMLVGGNSTPFAPRSFFQRAVFSTFSVFYKSRKLIKNGDNVFGCTGSILAIRSNFAKTIRLPKIINEDAYLYLSCIKNGNKFAYQDKAIVYYKIPTNLGDYLRQIFRSTPEAVEVELEKYFGKLVEEEFSRPVNFYLQSIYSVFLKNPLEVAYIVLINFLCKPLYPVISKNYKLDWFTAGSTH